MAATDVLQNANQAIVTAGGTSAPSSGTEENWTVNENGSSPWAAIGTGGTQQFRIIDQADEGRAFGYEVMIVTGRPSSTNWNPVIRGAEGTQPKAHAQGWVAIPSASAGAILNALDPIGAADAAAAASLPLTGGAVSGPVQFSGQFLVFGAPNVRLPAGTDSTMNGSLLATDTTDVESKVIWQVTGQFKGGFSGENDTDSVNPTFIWGSDMYFYSGDTSGDLAGITDFWGVEMEAHLATPSASINNLKGLIVLAQVDSTATDASVGVLYGIHVLQPGALPSAATVTRAYGVKVDSPTLATAPSNGTFDGNWGYYQDGQEPNLFGGKIITYDQDVNVGNGNIFAKQLIVGNPPQANNAGYPFSTSSSQGPITVYPNALGSIAMTIQHFGASPTGDMIDFKAYNGVINASILASGTYLSDQSGQGVILKDSASHYWRVTVTTGGTLTTTDLGTSRPTT